jgi:cytochrome c peroxidase
MFGRILGATAVILMLSGCGDASGVDDEPIASTSEELSGAMLYTTATFGGNGRTCATCHPLGTGTFSAQDAQWRYQLNKHDPLFRDLDSDNGNGHSYKRLLSDATVFVTIDLPSNVKIAGKPWAKTAKFARGTPTTMDTPALDPVLMWDGRIDTLQDQAKGAITGHAEGNAPSIHDLNKIADFEESTLFSSLKLLSYAKGGPAPTLPKPNTASEKRGAAWFDTTQASGVCAHCHSGPMLNETNQYNVFGLPPGTRFVTAFVSELNPGNRPTQTFIFTNPDSSKTTVTTPDPGRALITGKAADVNFFKIPTLWNVKATAPYFHDNSAASLEELMDHYNNFFTVFTNGALTLTAQDKADIIAYLKLL